MRIVCSVVISQVRRGILDPVSWRHRIAVVLLVVFAGLPVSGTVCAMVCDSASSAVTTHHSGDQECDQSVQPTTGPQIGGYHEHDCSTHQGAVRQAITTAAERADVTAKVAPLATQGIPIEFVALRAATTLIEDSSPPGTAPATATPLVLRV